MSSLLEEEPSEDEIEVVSTRQISPLRKRPRSWLDKMQVGSDNRELKHSRADHTKEGPRDSRSQHKRTRIDKSRGDKHRGDKHRVVKRIAQKYNKVDPRVRRQRTGRVRTGVYTFRKAFYARMILHINMLRLLGGKVPSFGPEVIRPPAFMHLGYGLVNAEGTEVSILSETREDREKLVELMKSRQPLPRVQQFYKSREDLPVQKVFTDGSYYPKLQLSGYAVWWGRDHPNNAFGPVPARGPLSSTKAEEYAIFLALLQVKQDISWNGTELRRYCILSDCLWAIDDIHRWYRKWNKPICDVGWKTPPIASTRHREILRVAAGLLWDLRFSGAAVEVTYVKGHAGISGNEMADVMAKLGSKSGFFVGPQPRLIEMNGRGSGSAGKAQD